MSSPTQSYLDVQYDLRPAKQVERRMLIDIFLKLMKSGFPLQDYQYTGFGSIYFVDFILLHRYLGMHKLQSVEHDLSIEKRVRFNSPFAPIEIQMAPISDVIPQLDSNIKHILWLDYDCRINPDLLSDIVLASHHLPNASILLLTVDIEPPINGHDPETWMAYYEENAEGFLEFGWSASNFSPSNLPATILRIIMNAISNGLAGRRDIQYQPLVRYVYADGHNMITVGGMIATQEVNQRIHDSGIAGLPFARLDTGSDFYHIKVPRLTRKERLHLDQFMPCADGWVPDAFELSSEEVHCYRDIYRFHPAYAELLL